MGLASKSTTGTVVADIDSISDEDVAVRRIAGLLTNPAITSLDFNLGSCGDRGARLARALGALLEGNCSVTFLRIRGMLQYEGAQALAAALRGNSTVVTLNLHSCQIGTRGAQAFGEAMRQNRTLRVCDLSYNEINSPGLQPLIDALKEENNSLCAVDLDGNPAQYMASSRNRGRHILQALQRALKRNYLQPMLLPYYTALRYEAARLLHTVHALPVALAQDVLRLTFYRSLGEYLQNSGHDPAEHIRAMVGPDQTHQSQSIMAVVDAKEPQAELLAACNPNPISESVGTFSEAVMADPLKALSYVSPFRTWSLI